MSRIEDVPPAIGPEPATQPAPHLPASETDPFADAAGDGYDPDRSALSEAWRLLRSSWAGRLGLVMFATLTLLSLWVLFTYPRDFGRSVWSSPAVWVDNPKNAPPAWTARFNGGTVQGSQTLDGPTDTRDIAAGAVQTWAFPLDVGERPPASLSMTFTGIEYSGRPPALLVSLVRPDGAAVRLAAVSVPGPRPGETAPFRRWQDDPLRVPLSDGAAVAQNLARFWATEYPGAPLPGAGSTLPALFGTPADADPAVIEPLPGAYRVEVQVVMAAPEDRLSPVRLTTGGTVYGIMGTDGLGRDLWRGLLYGFPVALLIATLTSLASTVIGATLGVISGYRGGRVDSAIQRASDVISNVPTLPLLIFLVSVLGRHLWLIMLVLVAFSWPGLTILVRSMVLQIRSGNLVDAAQALGASRGRIMRRHVFPQVAPYIVAQMIFFAPGAILAEASLSFLGLGDPSIPTWGQMLEAGFRTGALYVGYWWWVLPPGILIVITAIAFMLLALALEPIVDPRLRRPS
jgi:peptide/nickel transport system permease protein